MTETYPSVPYSYADADPNGTAYGHDKKPRFVNGGGSSPSGLSAGQQPSPSSQSPALATSPHQGYPSMYSSPMMAQGGGFVPVGAQNNVAAMAAMLAAQQQHNGIGGPGMSNGPYGAMAQNGVGMNAMNGMVTGMMNMGLHSGMNHANFSHQASNSPFLGNHGAGGFSPAMGVANAGGLSPNPGHGNFASPMLGNFPSPNSANFATFPSPALSQGSFGGLPTGGSTFGQNGMQMQQMMGLGLQGGAQNGMAQANAGVQTGRTVYVGSLPPEAAVDELLSQVRFGPIENVKILPEKNCAFLSFIDPTTAAAFHSDALMRKIQLHGQELKIGWGKPSAVPAPVMMAVQQHGATRNVYLGNLDESFTEQSLRDDLSRFGPIDQVKIVRDKNIGFIHFLSIATAIKVVSTLATEPEWAGRRVNYGKDRCAYVPKNQHQQQQHNMAAAAMAATAAGYVGFSAGINGVGLDPNQVQPGNRTVYLGNIHPETSLEEICNTIRGGILQQIRYIQDKHIAFVTFVDANAALAFFHMATFQGINLHNRRLKVGWGKHSGPPSPGIAMVVQAGGSRNVYIGQIDDFDQYDEAKIRTDFSQYGEIELVNLLKEKNCAFVNFTNIANSIKAIEGMKQNPDYSRFKIAYGKDRCANAPRNAPWAGLLSPPLGGTPRTGQANGYPQGDLSPSWSMGGFSPMPPTDESGADGLAINGHATPEIKPEA